METFLAFSSCPGEVQSFNFLASLINGNLINDEGSALFARKKGVYLLTS
jgi:hypothetical protein